MYMYLSHILQGNSNIKECTYINLTIRNHNYSLFTMLTIIGLKSIPENNKYKNFVETIDKFV